MTLGSDTAAVLMRAMDMLHHQTSLTQHTHLSADERKAALQQLLATVETAAKLADVAHVEAVAAAAERNAAGSDTDRIMAQTEMFKAEATKLGREAERVMRETERTRAETEKARCGVEWQTAATAPPAGLTAANLTSIGTLGIRPSPPAQNGGVPASGPSPEQGISIYALHMSHPWKKEIEEMWEDWNSKNVEQYSLAGWGWFKHSKTTAFLFLNVPGKGEYHLLDIIRERTGTIELPKHMFDDLDRDKGYEGSIYGPRQKSGKRDRVRFTLWE
ncbi:hypothetical protein DFP73DRAFT_567210 [Morchella snyderi]|nr:hypothetical protein DFP73DRAFT_567210 [Morchella snyderi]